VGVKSREKRERREDPVKAEEHKKAKQEARQPDKVKIAEVYITKDSKPILTFTKSIAPARVQTILLAFVQGFLSQLAEVEENLPQAMEQAKKQEAKPKTTKSGIVLPS